ncbi:Nfu1 protein [Saccharomycopsis crataegensis]|uniref:Nfu1 protein n=1 Tax=Saccharomycopsis crataegensis TaxID=43959 RepID=A0AAV5QSP3_9ASCO|nr:Nfu1 protein [Saccharomycopsis crataegensis]
MLSYYRQLSILSRSLNRGYRPATSSPRWFSSLHQNVSPRIQVRAPSPVARLISIRSLFIRTVETPNEDALKFLPSVQILPETTSQTLEYLSGRDAFNSPLVRKLFTIDGISSVMLGPNFITIEKSRDLDIDWAILKPEIFSTLTDFLSSGEPIIDPDAIMEEDVGFNEEDDEVVGMIKELMFTRIRPAIQEDGGDIEFVEFREDSGTVVIRLRGACRSCDSSSITLKNGIEAMLKHYIEEVQEVIQMEEQTEEKVEKEEPKPSGLNLSPTKRVGAEEEVPPIL